MIPIVGKQSTPRDSRQGNSDSIISDSWGAFPTTALPPIPVARWIRNGKAPNASYESLKTQSLEQAVMLRGKEVFRSPGQMGASGLGGNNAPRYRFAWHSGPYTRLISVLVTMRPNSSAIGTNSNSFVQFDVTDGATTTTESFYFGPTVTVGGVELFRTVQKLIAINPNTTYYGVFTEQALAQLHSVLVYEAASMTEVFGGYLPSNFSVGGPILDSYRQNAATIARAMWSQGGSQLLNFSTERDGDSSQATATLKNVADNTTTAVSANSRGFVVDLSGRASRSQTSVPCGIAINMKNAGATFSAGQVVVKNQSGATVYDTATSGIGSWPPDSATHWLTGTLTLPAIADKYDVFYCSTANLPTVFFNAISIWDQSS